MNCIFRGLAGLLLCSLIVILTGCATAEESYQDSKYAPDAQKSTEDSHGWGTSVGAAN